MQIDKNTQADFDWYSDVVKDDRGSRPRGAEAEWFCNLSEAALFGSNIHGKRCFC